jgi:hypothetical protein
VRRHRARFPGLAMDELTRLGVVLLIVIGVPVWASVARRAAISVDEQGGPGWLVGTLVLLLPPVGLIVWLRFNNGSLRATR